MKRWVWLVGAMCAAAAGFLVLGAPKLQPVESASGAASGPAEEFWESPTTSRRS
jgi:hypothetical protein